MIKIQNLWGESLFVNKNKPEKAKRHTLSYFEKPFWVKSKTDHRGNFTSVKKDKWKLTWADEA